MQRPNDLSSFWAKVHKTDDCWEWTAARMSSGYGGFYWQRGRVPAHRFSWEIAFGAIPEGMFVCHHCDNRLCVRPDHLFLGTALDNARDCVAKGRLALLILVGPIARDKLLRWHCRRVEARDDRWARGLREDWLTGLGYDVDRQCADRRVRATRR